MMPLDIYEAESQFVIKADLPGIKKDEIKIQLNKNQLTIEAVTPAAEKKKWLLLFKELPGALFLII